MEPNTIDLDQEWDYVQKGIIKMTRIAEGLPESPFSLKEKMMLYTTIYKMCNHRFPDYRLQLYEKYKEALEEYISSTVLPPLREKHDEFMLSELVKRWDNYKDLIRWLLHFFHYLDRNFIRQRLLPPLNEVGLTCFRDLVYAELKDKAKDVVIALIDKERGGEQIDRALLKNVLGIFVEIGMGQRDSYEKDFERHMLQDTGAYYSRKASNWIVQDSCPDYMIKAEECLRKERDRVSHYLHSSSELKLVERVQHELLVVYATQLLEKEQSGCCALLREDKVEDLSRIYRLYRKIPKGLEPVANVFKQHITAEGTSFVQQAEDVATNRGGNAGAAVEQVLIRKITELHDKYIEYVTNCFLNHTLFHKALKEAFALFCNKIVGGSLGSELLATFCDNILKKGGNEKLKDEEAIEETIDKLPMPCGRDEYEQVLDDEIDEGEEKVDDHSIVYGAEYDDEEEEDEAEEVYDDDEEEEEEHDNDEYGGSSLSHRQSRSLFFDLEVYDDDEEEEEDDEYRGGSLSHKPKRRSRSLFFDLEAPRKKRKENFNLNG